MKTIIPNVQVKAVSAWLPENRLDLKTLSKEYGEVDVQNIMRVTGADYLRIADHDMTSADMCQKAAEHLLACGDIDRNDIDGLDVIDFGLGSVLYDVKTKTYYTPNTNESNSLKTLEEESIIDHDNGSEE